jgi:hypothetical protein
VDLSCESWSEGAVGRLLGGTVRPRYEDILDRRSQLLIIVVCGQALLLSHPVRLRLRQDLLDARVGGEFVLCPER